MTAPANNDRPSETQKPQEGYETWLDWLIAIETVRGNVNDHQMSYIKAELAALRAKAKSCPCLHGTPCTDQCTCANRLSSFGCYRCCAHGNDDQRRELAKYIEECHLKAAAYDEAMAKIMDVLSKWDSTADEKMYLTLKDYVRDERVSGRFKP